MMANFGGVIIPMLKKFIGLVGIDCGFMGGKRSNMRKQITYLIAVSHRPETSYVHYENLLYNGIQAFSTRWCRLSKLDIATISYRKLCL